MIIRAILTLVLHLVKCLHNFDGKKNFCQNVKLQLSGAIITTKDNIKKVE